MNYYNEIKSKLIDNEIYSRIKDYSKERNTVITYCDIGKLLYEAGSKYGDSIIEKYSEKLINDVGKKYNKRTLFRMRQFYKLFSDEKVSTMSTQLSWSHYTELLSINDKNKLLYYLELAINQSIDVRTLRLKIKNKEYERLFNEAKNKLIIKENIKINDFIKNPILIKNSLNYNDISEKVLKKLVLGSLSDFMKELGNGFCFIDSEYKIKLGNRYNYIDLLLFNYIYNCFIAVELKVTELKKEHIGQIQIYMNYIDRNIKSITQNKTIGIIICKKDNHYVMEYCSDDRIINRIYELV